MDRAGRFDKQILGEIMKMARDKMNKNLNPKKLQHSCMHNLFHPVTRKETGITGVWLRENSNLGCRAGAGV